MITKYEKQKQYNRKIEGKIAKAMKERDDLINSLALSEDEVKINLLIN